MQQQNAMFVCHVCIGDPYLSKEVKQRDSRKLCSYCGETRKAHSLKGLADRIHEKLEERFKLVQEDSWQWSGTPLAEVIAEIAVLSEEIADDVRLSLSDRYGEVAVKDGEDDPYSEDAHYEKLEPNDWHLRDLWSLFCISIRSRERFFSKFAEQVLSMIFSDLKNYKTDSDKPVIREIGPEDEDRFIWRARKSQSDKILKDILKSPAQEIGPPPSRKAQGGRMNATGIQVFYGAMDETTCVAEARAPVGSKVVIAKFELILSVRLLDFDALAEIFVEGSYFDPGYAEREARAAFLRQLVLEISRPVMPQDETLEYLPTQVVAEYLANKSEPPLDGIIFRSSQTGGTGRNLVLFNHACGVEPLKLLEGVDATIRIPRGGEEDRDISIFEDVLADLSAKASPSENRKSSGGLLSLSVSESGWNEDISSEDDELLAFHDPFLHKCLRLDLESVVVLDIEGVSYESVRRRVIRFSNTKSN